MNHTHALTIALLVAGTLTAQSAQREAIVPTSAVEFAEHVRPFLAKNCYRCHGEKKQKAGLSLHDIDGVITNGVDIIRWEKVQELVSLGEMPPRRKLARADRHRFLEFVGRELRKLGRGFDEAKLALPGQGNRVDHEELFSGVHTGPAFSPPRLWRKSPHAYRRFSREMRVQLAQPFLGMGGKDFQDYALLYADEATISTMLRNSGLVAKKILEVGPRTRFRHLFVDDPPDQKRRRKESVEQQVQRALRDIFRMIFQRDPTERDRATFIAEVFEKNRELGGLRLGLETMITAMLMSREFVFRMELGMGEALPDGRRRLSPMELAYALSYAFLDRPDPEVVKAAKTGKP